MGEAVLGCAKMQILTRILGDKFMGTMAECSTAQPPAQGCSPPGLCCSDLKPAQPCARGCSRLTLRGS